MKGGGRPARLGRASCPDATAPSETLAASGRDARPPIRFVIYAAPRTGSNQLCATLGAHPQVLCHHELFNSGGIHYSLDHRNGEIELGTPQERDRDPLAFVERVWRHSLGRRAVGFKLNRDDWNDASAALLLDRDVQKIVLRRRNRVRMFVSELIAQQTGVWESYARDSPSPGAARHPLPASGARGNIGGGPSPRVEPADLLAHVERTRVHYERITTPLANSGQTYLEVFYEELDDEVTLARIQRFIGVDLVLPLPTRTMRMHGQPLRELIANYDALRAALEGSDLAEDLEA